MKVRVTRKLTRLLLFVLCVCVCVCVGVGGCSAVERRVLGRPPADGQTRRGVAGPGRRVLPAARAVAAGGAGRRPPAAAVAGRSHDHRRRRRHRRRPLSLRRPRLRLRRPPRTGTPSSPTPVPRFPNWWVVTHQGS